MKAAKGARALVLGALVACADGELPPQSTSYPVNPRAPETPWASSEATASPSAAPPSSTPAMPQQMPGMSMPGTGSSK